LRKDVDFLVRDISEDYMSVSNGEIRHLTTEDIRSTFARYLNSTTFTEYRDLRTTEDIRSTFARYLNSTTFTEYRDLREPIVGF